ncbi:hypothetical protein BU23DRAFT_519906 [Bimuria novae-zelandiae CBS 107.79]|uniref:Zn(2)-C6 fungal-type domain-containing protein n=1 Tax=Bimuria novae-zelandiae CBS 107.79 TaxID=1447943 RepID=A0A6A5UW39_9PLEO|nr:hypothetical protein BU23DRAFT_519906 [Bimuria novae-zelandiae CBS 107.79]
MDRPVSKSSAAYGHACSNCVKAKCRCILREGGGCERCHRLSRECHSASFVRKKGSQKAARKSQLEDKLDSIVTLLQAQHAPTPYLTPSPPSQSKQAQQYPADPLFAPTSRPLKPLPSDQTPQQVLSTFRTRYMEHFPFISLPTDDVSIEAFVHERPNTYRAIQVICEKNRARQVESGIRVREELALRVVSGGERSIDLLLCLLVCLTWQVYFTVSRRGGVGMFLNVAKHVIADLGYNRPTGIIMACPKPPVIVGQLPDQHETRNDEERRALVGCFALSAVTGLAIKTEPIRWSSLISRACDRLSRNLDNKGDTILVAMARIARVSVDAYNTLVQIQDDPDTALHALHQVRALKVMLDMVKNGLTPDQLQNSTVLHFFHGVEVQIHEPALYDISPLNSNATLDYQRIEYLTACLHACKASLDVYLTIPAITMNMVQVLIFSNTCQILYTLSAMECMGWDRVAARSTADVLWYFDQLKVKFAEACRQMQEENGGTENVFSLAGGHDGLGSVSAKWKECLDSATGASLDFTSELGGVGDAWMTNADMWFTNVWGETQF